MSQQPYNQTLWRRYRASRKAKIGSVLMVLLVIVPLLFTVLRVQIQTLLLKPDITVDFGSRQNHSHPIPIQFGLAGKGIFGVIDHVSNYLPPANITLDSYIVQMENIFNDPNSLTDPAKQDWSSFDSIMSKAQAAFGSTLLLTLQGVPAWLQPQNQTPSSPNYCLLDPTRQQYPFHAFPTHPTSKGDNGLALFSQLPRLLVAHMDKYFPDIHPNYELWNEPDGYNSWCTQHSDPHADQTRYTWYKAIYTVCAPLMKTQAREDHAPIKIGGPTLAYYAHFDTWFPKFLNDPQIAPYIDFITYHQYVSGQTWDSTQNSTKNKAKGNLKSVFDATQDPEIGYAAIYEKVSQYVHQGKQPDAQSTPIYISEYNCPAFCRNSPIYAPLWNSLFVADLLNSVNDKTAKYAAAAYLPAGLGYWAGSGVAKGGNYYCMFGMLDTSLDCSTNGITLQPYPQYYSYLLLGGKRYLGLTDSGYMVNSATTALKGLVITDFYTRTKDNVLIINASGQAYSQVNIAVTETGTVKTSASYYILDQANPHISTQGVKLTSVNNGYIASVNLPAYSTVALSLDVSS